jgi:hypothetical protein
MPERRKIPRRNIMCYARLFDLSSGSPIGFLLNIHKKGMMVLSEQALQPGNSYRFRLELPDKAFERSYLELNARCVWCRPDVDPDFHSAGFRLLGVLPKEVKIIEQLNTLYEQSPR